MLAQVEAFQKGIAKILENRNQSAGHQTQNNSESDNGASAAATMPTPATPSSSIAPNEDAAIDETGTTQAQHQGEAMDVD